MNYKLDGGGISPNNFVYAQRDSDTEFLEAMQRGEYCHVFSGRQMGKTSLLFKTKEELKRQGHKCIWLNFSPAAGSLEQWYKNMTRRLGEGLEVFSNNKILNDEKLDNWLDEQKPFSISTYLDFIDKIVLRKIPGNIYIFYDEINVAQGFTYSTDDFWSAIKRIHDKRQDDSEYGRLTFAFSGVTTPDDLIRNKSATTFGIGRAFELAGIELKGAESFLEGLKDNTENPEAVLKEIIKSTGGQPFLVQQYCSKVQDRNYVKRRNEKKRIKEINRLYVEEWKNPVVDSPEHFKTIEGVIVGQVEKRIKKGSDLNTEDSNNPDIYNILKVYQKILKNGLVFRKNYSEECQKLFGWGLVKMEGGKVSVFCPLYKKIFSPKWAKKHIDSICPKKHFLIRKNKQIILFLLLVTFGVSNIKNVKRYASNNQEIQRGYFSRTCRNMEIDKNGILFSLCMTMDRRSLAIYYDINNHIANKDGNLKWSREGNYAKTCKHNKIDRVDSNSDAYLVSDCAKLDGSWKPTRLNLDERIDNTDGELRYYEE